MAKIHGIVYLIIGIFVAVASYKINYDKLYFFFYIGLLFITYGVAKIILGFIWKNDKEEKTAARNNLQKTANQQIPKQQYKRCPRCGNVARAHDNFCPRCGNRLYF